MIKFKKSHNVLLLIYSPDNEIAWLKQRFKDNEPYRYGNTFILKIENVYGDIEEQYINGEIIFKIAELRGDYYHFDSQIFEIARSLFVNKDVKFERKFFIANRNISIVRKIDDILDLNEKEIRIGTEEVM